MCFCARWMQKPQSRLSQRADEGNFQTLLFESALLALPGEGGFSSDVFPGFVLPLTARRGQNEKLLSWSFFLRALKVLQKGGKNHPDLL